MKWISKYVCSLCLGIAAFGGAAAISQQVPGKSTPNIVPVHVTVTDQSGAIIPGADVHMFATSNSELTEAFTGRDGRSLVEIAPGSYRLVVMSPGFVTLTQSVEVSDTNPEYISAVMQVGNVCSPCVVLSPVYAGPATELTPINLLIQSYASTMQLPRVKLRTRRHWL